MSNEDRKVFCNCKEVEEKLISLLNDNGNLLQMIRRLRKENEGLESEVKRLGMRSAGSGSRRGRTGTDNSNAEVESLIGINHGWKRDYEELRKRYEFLSGEKKLLEEEETKTKERIVELERRLRPRENDERVRPHRVTVSEEDFERAEILEQELKRANDMIKTLIKKLVMVNNTNRATAPTERAQRLQVLTKDGHAIGRLKLVKWVEDAL